MTFIKQQKELVRKNTNVLDALILYHASEGHEGHPYQNAKEDLDTLITTLLTSVGAEIERRLEEEKTPVNALNLSVNDIDELQKEAHNHALDTAITIIREVTGREAE